MRFSHYLRLSLFAILVIVGHARSDSDYTPYPENAPPPSKIPPWWFQRDVIERTSPTLNPVWPEDYGPQRDWMDLTKGELRKMAVAAYQEMEAHLEGGAGAEVTALVKGWDQTKSDRAGSQDRSENQSPAESPADASNATSVTYRELKEVAKPFYDRLIQARLQAGYPWASQPTPEDNAATASLGQAKRIFTFEVFVDKNGDGIPDGLEASWGLDPTDPAAGSACVNGSGRTALEYFLEGATPSAQPPTDSFQWLHVYRLRLRQESNPDGSCELYWSGEPADLATLMIQEEVPPGPGEYPDWNERIFRVIAIAPAKSEHYHVEAAAVLPIATAVVQPNGGNFRMVSNLPVLGEKAPLSGLPGVDTNIDEAVAASEVIVTGWLQALGESQPVVGGGGMYDHATIKVIKLLKGDSANDDVSACITVRFDKVHFEEITPEAGKRYIFFISSDEQKKRNVAAKMLPDDLADEAAVSTVIQIVKDRAHNLESGPPR